MNNSIDISQFDYPLDNDRIAKFPLERREESKLLIYRGGDVSHSQFYRLSEFLPERAVLVFNNTRVVRARLIFHKQSGARIEIFCLEPASPADYERSFAAVGGCSWHCIIGNSKKWKEGQQLELIHGDLKLCASRDEGDVVSFSWDGEHTWGEVLEMCGNIPIPPYLNRESQEIDNERYQTVYSLLEGSVAAPTAGLHFTDSMLEELCGRGVEQHKVTLHVGAGTFLPVKVKDAREHDMHTECFEILTSELDAIANCGRCVVAVGTTSVRTLESLAVLGERVMIGGDPDFGRAVGQWEAYRAENLLLDHNSADIRELHCLRALRALGDWCKAHGVERIMGSTQIMITPGYRFRVVGGMITNFHQPKSTLLLLISAFIGDDWHKVYDYALSNDFRFLSYGDSSLLLPNETKVTKDTL